MAPASVDERHAANGRAFAADRRHQQMAAAGVVNTTATRAMKKARGLRATRVGATRVIMETSPREEGDNGHNNQLGTKAAAMARTVVATTARVIMMAARATPTGAKMVTALVVMTATMAMMVMMATAATTATMATTVTITPNGNDNYKNQMAITARVMTTVARAMVAGSKRAMATMATTATMVTMATMTMMTPNSDDAASDGKGNEDTKQ
jgi:hypothetical protein